MAKQFVSNTYIYIVCTYVYMYTCMYVRILYGGKIWRRETLGNLANDHKFAKFKPSKFYFSNTSRVAEAYLARYTNRQILFLHGYVYVRS